MSLPLNLASLNVFISAYSQSDFFGKLIFLGLITLSIICWVVLLHKIWLVRQVKKISDAFQETLEEKKEALFNVDLNEFPAPRRKEIPHPFAEIFTSLKDKTLEILNKNLYFTSQRKPAGENNHQVYLSRADLELIESHALTSISIQSKKLDKSLFILATVVTLAPFLGLLGTVWGILITFAELHSGGSASSNSVILGGLSTALATTVLGLVIAIPALIAYNYLKNSTKNLSSDMEDFLYDLLSNVEIQYRKADLSE
jgi:biopolymer transport protein TolQ